METKSIIGKGIVLPFERHGSDFNNAEGSDVIESSLKQILTTKKGELRWNPDFGLPPLLHQSIDDMMFAQLQADVASAVTKYEPRIEIVDITVRKGGDSNTYPDNSVVISIQWRAVIRGKKGNTVLTDTSSTEVVV